MSVKDITDGWYIYTVVWIIFFNMLNLSLIAEPLVNMVSIND